MKYLCYILLTFCMVDSCLAQASLTLYDGNDEKIGFLVSADLSSNIWMSTYDGYLIQVDTTIGEIWRYNYESSVIYESDDCSGQPYIDSTSSEPQFEWMDSRGGQIFQLGPNSFSPYFAKIEWGIGTRSVNERSYRSIDALYDCRQLIRSRNGVPISFIDPLVYKIDQWWIGGYRFYPPITARLQQSDVVFCSGFESCPTSSAE